VLDDDEVEDAGTEDEVAAEDVVPTDDAEVEVAALEEVAADDTGVGEGDGSGFESPPPPPQALMNVLKQKDKIRKPFRFIKNPPFQRWVKYPCDVLPS
jgi:hypothetical protein